MKKKIKKSLIILSMLTAILVQTACGETKNDSGTKTAGDEERPEIGSQSVNNNVEIKPPENLSK